MAMTDTSKEAVENFIQSVLKEAVLSEGLPRTSEDTEDVHKTVALLRALAAKLAEVTAERDSNIARAINSSEGHIAMSKSAVRGLVRRTESAEAKLAEVEAELEQMTAIKRIHQIKRYEHYDRAEAAEAERDEQIAWVKSLADQLIAAEAKLAKVTAERDKAQKFGQDMVVRAASGGVLDGYRELGAKAAAAEARAEAAEAALVAACETLTKIANEPDNAEPALWAAQALYTADALLAQLKEKNDD